jgi:hypothetical protein
MDQARKLSFQSATFSTTREDKPYPLSPTAFPGPSGSSIAPPKLGGTLEPVCQPMFPDARLEQFKKTSSVGRDSPVDSLSTKNSSREGGQTRKPNQFLGVQERRIEEREKYPNRYEDDKRMRPIEGELMNDRRRDPSLDRRRDRSLEKRTTRRSERRDHSPERREHAYENDEWRKNGGWRPQDRWEEVSEASFGQEGYRAPRRHDPEARAHKQFLQPRNMSADEYDLQEGLHTTGLGRPSIHEYGNRRPLHYYVDEDAPTHRRTPRAGYRDEEGHVEHRLDVDPYAQRTRTRELDELAFDRYGYPMPPRSPRLPQVSPRVRSDYLDQYHVDRLRATDRYSEERDLDYIPSRSPLHGRDEPRMEGRGRGFGQVSFGEARGRDYRPRSPGDIHGRSLSRLPPRGRSKSGERNPAGRVDTFESSYGTRSRTRDSRLSDEYISERSRGTREITVESDRRSVGSSLSGDQDPISSRREGRSRREDDCSSETSSLQPHHRVHNFEEPSVSEESEGNYYSGRARDRRSASAARSHRPRSRSADRKNSTPTHFVIEVQEEIRPDDRGVTFSPSTDLPASSSSAFQDLTETSLSSTDRTYAKRLADAALMKEQSEARHQILREVRQAMEMRDISSEVEDRLFWEKQIATLNGSLKSLCSLHASPSQGSGWRDSTNGAFNSGSGADVPWSTPSPSQSNHTTVKVQAPENLPAGHQFTVRLNGRVLKATVPSGGVRKGDVFSIRIPSDKAAPATPMHSQSPASVKVRAPASLPEGYRFTAKMGDRTIVATVPSGGVQKGQIFAVPVVEEHQYSI